MNPITEAERKLPKPHKAHELWEAFYDGVVNQNGENEARRGIKRIRQDYNISPELETAISEGEYGLRLQGIRLLALQRTGVELTKGQKEFIFDKFDLIKGGPSFGS